LLVPNERYHSLRYPIWALFMAAVAGAWVAARRPFRVAVEGMSMAPTLLPGDLLVAVHRPVRRNDLVVMEHPARPGYEMVKRVVGLAGDTIDGAAIGPGELWLRGDNPVGSTDSRTMGAFPRDGVRGVVRFRYWPPSRAGRVGRSFSTRHLVSPSS
jgi:signal peptidase I